MKKQNTPKPVVFIPRRFFILKHFHFPFQSKERLHKAILLQLPKHIPYKEGEFAWGFSILEETAASVKVMVLVISNDVVEAHIAKLAPGLRSCLLTMSSFGLLRFAEQGVHMIISVDGTGAEICFCDSKRLFYSRAIEGQEESLADEAVLSLDIYRKEKMGPEPLRLTLIGVKGELFKGLGLPISVQHSIARPVNPQAVIDFWPEKNKVTERRRVVLRERLKLSLLVAVAFISLCAAASAGIYQKSILLSRLGRELNNRRPQVAQAQKNILRRQAASKELKGSQPVLEILEELYRLTPQDIAYDHLNIQPSGEIVLQGISRTASGLNQLQNNLVGSLVLKEVTLQQANKRIGPAGEMTYFSMRARGRERL